MWKRFVLASAATCGLGLALVYLFVLLIDPYGVSPLRVISTQHVVHAQRRFVVPQVVRDVRYDTMLVGTSTIAPIDPVDIERVFGGRAANVAIHGATPYEQSRLARLVFRRNPAPKLVLFGLDQVWCADFKGPEYHPGVRLPDWLYDDVPLGSLAYLLNWRAVDMAKRKLDIALGRSKRAIPPNGFLDELPPDEQWTSEKARKLVANFSKPVPLKVMPPSWQLPEVERLGRLLQDLKPETRLVLVLMPAFQLKTSDAVDEARIDTCKSRIAGIAKARGARLVDFAFANAVTTNAKNFWDSEHFRNPTSRALPGWIAKALAAPPGTVTELYRVP